MKPDHQFGARRVYYNNFAAHLLNAYNPNMLYPDLPYRWSDADWRGLIEMIAAFGFNVFEFWLVPRLFCRNALESELGREFTRQLNVVIEHAHKRDVKVEMLCSLATVGPDWRTFCPNVKAEWEELRFLWSAWAQRFPELDIAGIFPGDPGGCSRNGCTAETYIDKSVEIAGLIKEKLPRAEIEFHTWGPPFFAWGIIQGPPGWQGEFAQADQHTAWVGNRQRTERSMIHLLKRLPDFPEPTSVAINLGFNADGDPKEGEDGRPWAREIAKSHRILTWNFSLTEGENAIVPHFRFERLFAQRRKEREAAPYSGGICFTMTPLLNQLSLYEAAHSFTNPDADWRELAGDFFEAIFGPAGRDAVDFLPLFEVVPDWGNYAELDLSREEYHARMTRFVSLLEDLKGSEGNRGMVDASLSPDGSHSAFGASAAPTLPLHPSPEAYRQEVLFFAGLVADLTAPAPDIDRLRQRYWDRVYAIYDQLPEHVDPRPHAATDRLIQFFQEKMRNTTTRQ